MFDRTSLAHLHPSHLLLHGRMAMTLCVLGGMLAALAFYLATAHQRLLPSLRPWARSLRVAAWILSLGSPLAAVHALGLWAGVFAALSVVMLGMVLLPYVDAWLHDRSTRHVG